MTSLRAVAVVVVAMALMGARSAHAAQQTHRLFAVVDVLHRISPRLNFDFNFNFGVGYNLTGSGDRWVIKGIIGLGL